MNKTFIEIRCRRSVRITSGLIESIWLVSGAAKVFAKGREVDVERGRERRIDVESAGPVIGNARLDKKESGMVLRYADRRRANKPSGKCAIGKQIGRKGATVLHLNVTVCTRAGRSRRQFSESGASQACGITNETSDSTGRN